MTQQLISLGTGPNTGTGDPGFTAFTKVNANFTELYGGTAPLVGPVTVGPPTGTQTALTINGALGGDAIDINLNQSPGVGFAENITGSSSADVRGIQVTNTFGGPTAGCYGFLVGNDGTHTLVMGKTSTLWSGSKFINGPAGEISWLWSGGAVPLVIAFGSGQQAIGVSGVGAVTVGPPTSGIALAVNQVAGGASSAIAVTGTGGTCYASFAAAATNITALSINQTGQSAWSIYQPASSSDFRIFSGGDKFIITNAGNVTIPAPSSGVSLNVTGFSNAVGAPAVNLTGPGGYFLEFGPASHTGALYCVAGGIQIGSTTADSVGLFVNNGSPSLTIATTGAITLAAPTAGQTLTVTGLAGSGNYAAKITSPNSAGNSWGLFISAGTNSSDLALEIANAPGTALMAVFGDGSVTVGSPTGGAKGVGTINCQAIYVNGTALTVP